MLEGLLIWRTIIDIDIRDGGNRNENVGADEFGKFFGGVIFIYNSIDTFEALQDFGADDRNTTATRGDDNSPVFDEVLDGFFFDNIDRFGASNDTAPTATSIFFDGPALFTRESFRFFFGIELADRFGGVFESGIIAANYDLRNNGDDFFVFAFFSEGIVDSLGEPITDLTLAHSDGSLKRHSRCLFGRGGLFVNENVANLGAIAMGDDDFVLVSEFGDSFAYFNGDFLLGFGRGFTVFLESVPAEC